MPHWSMFQAENAWGWLKRNARSAKHAEATMLFAWQDKMLTDMYFLRSLAPRNPYYYTEQYINDPTRITTTLPDIHRTYCTLDEHVALIQYYAATLPGFGRLWASAITLYTNTHSTAQCREVGLHLKDGVYSFVSDDKHHLFYKRHFRGEFMASP